MKKFLITFVISFIGFYIIEHVVAGFLGLEIHDLNFGWLGYAGFILFYGFKYHILCCLVPFVFTAYKCRHKKCKHEHCEPERLRKQEIHKLDHMNTTADKEWSNATWEIKKK